jgi:hypothetical protein
MGKILYFITAAVLFLSHSSCTSAQDNTSNKEIIATLNEFYIGYSAIWSTTPSLSPGILNSKLDSIQEKYCTLKLRSEAKEYLEDGHDLLTNDYGIGRESLETLTIVKDSTKASSYIVTYVVVNSDAANNPVKQQVSLHVFVVKEKDEYKIDDVR